MTTQGYSDRVNHALAFAAKHHDQQVRRGTRAPYLTTAANVALILTRYDREEGTVVAGILYDVVSDLLREGASPAVLTQRIGMKFGDQVLKRLLSIAERRLDDDGVELSAAERREDVLRRLEAADEEGRWVVAANALHHAGTLIAELQRTVDAGAVWSRLPAGPAGTAAQYRRLHDRLAAGGVRGEIMRELGDAVAAVERLAG